MVGGEVFFHKTPEKLKVVPFFVSELRKNLAIVYSRLGQYDLALECINEVLFLYKKIGEKGEKGEKGVKLIMREANLKINLGYILLMKNEIAESKQVLTNAINIKLQIKDFRDLFYAFVWRSEANIQLNNLEEAYNDCQKALNFMQELKSNFNKLMKIICYYNMAIAKYKLFDKAKSLEHFKAFFKLSNEFCEKFLEKSVHEKLLEENVFEFPKNESHIKLCLQNSLIIFSAIYGKNHSFVKNYVKVNTRK
jgi:tetratricopeptide (TPR) repeat protein